MVETKLRRVRIYQDEDAESPRDWDNLGEMVCWHRRYNLGDQQPKCDPEEWRRHLADTFAQFNTDVDNIPQEHIDRVLDKYVVILPLHLYDHSGITMSCSGFSCPWDSGQVGWIYMSMATARANWSGTDEEVRVKAERCLRMEVETYDQYLTGEVFCFVVEERESDRHIWEVVDSCSGFFGRDWETNGIADHLSEEDMKLIEED